MPKKMPYTTNPKLPKVRAQAVEMVRQGHSMRTVARHFGFTHSTIIKWNKRVPPGGAHTIPTKKSIPHSHPNALHQDIIQRIIELRKQTKRCAEVIHKMLLNEGIIVSLSSVKRTLDRQGLLKKKGKWSRIYTYPERPKALIPGDLVEIDTIHLMQTHIRRIYVYTLIDVYSRWAYARAFSRLSQNASLHTVRNARRNAPFRFSCIQSDHGPEFGMTFKTGLTMSHRHSRIRKPNDNGHLERFNRTIQEEFINSLPMDVTILNNKLPCYLRYYNKERLHLGINLKTPQDILDEWFQGAE